MAFTEDQSRQLKAKLRPKYVKSRQANGTTLHYIEGWHAIAEANRIFGHDGWDRRTLSTTCLSAEHKGDWYHAAYTARVRICVRAGDRFIVRDGSGTGEGKALTPGQAHELALKGAETDATKRALATFGNPFGLSLYDRDQLNGRKESGDQSGPWTLRSASGSFLGRHAGAESFAKALASEMSKADNIEKLFELWEQNVGTVRTLNALLNQGGKPGFGKRLVSHLKACAVALVEPTSTKGSSAAAISPRNNPGEIARGKIDKSALTLSTPKRHRSKEHLRFVASQPCLVCGRTPAQAHHIRFAQPKGLALKVSDEFTVPLCALHHRDNHTTGDERKWWQDHKIDPLPAAEQLWRQGPAFEASALPLQLADESKTTAQTNGQGDRKGTK